MEKEIKITTEDKFVINGTLNFQSESNKVIIFVHGLNGGQTEHHFFNGARFFTQKGFHTFRFDFYSREDECKKLKDSSIQTHAKDLEQIIHFFDLTYKEIHLIGHSLGGPSILWANHEIVKSVVLWDPSFNIMEDIGELDFNKELDKYFIHWGASILLSKEMVEDFHKVNHSILAKFCRPTKIICAGNSDLNHKWKNNMGKIQVKSELKTIKNAGHCFDEEGKENELFEETLDWISKLH